MHKLFLTLILFIVFGNQAHSSTITVLNEVNSEWKNNFDGQLLAAAVITGNNCSFNEWIKTHLMLVEQTLRQRPVRHLNANQILNRFRLLDELNNYWLAGIFPVNDYLTVKNPVFIDRIGTHCAVGYLMQQSNAEVLARKIDADNKFIYVKDIKTPGVKEWAFENGFTIGELAWIQPGYLPGTTVNDLDGGLNGSINSLIVDPASQLLYAGGSFSASTKGALCGGVALYINGIAGWDWVGLGNGVNGTVKAMLIHNNKLYVGGEFTMAGMVPAKNVAVYDLITNQWQSIGNLDSMVNSFAVYNNDIYAGGRFTGLAAKWTGNQWQDITAGFIYNGEVRTLDVWDNNLLIGGSFELATGALRRYVATYDGTQMGISGFGTVTPVNDFEVFHDTVYAACDVAAGTDTCAVARFVNFDWEVVLKPFSLPFSYFNGTSVQKLYVAGNRLFGAGNFLCAWGMYYGSSMMEITFDQLSGYPICNPLMFADSTVRTMTAYNNVITFGGDFIHVQNDTLNHVGQLQNILTAIPGNDKQTLSSIIVYPNPTSDNILVQFNNYSNQEAYYTRVMDEMGRVIYFQQMIQPISSMNFSGKRAGIYMVQVVDGNGNSMGGTRVVKR